MICVFSASRWRLCKATKVSARAVGVFVELQKSPREALMFLQSYKSLRVRRWCFCRVTKVSARDAGPFVALQKSYAAGFLGMNFFVSHLLTGSS